MAIPVRPAARIKPALPPPPRSSARLAYAPAQGRWWWSRFLATRACDPLLVKIWPVVAVTCTPVHAVYRYPVVHT